VIVASLPGEPPLRCRLETTRVPPAQLALLVTAAARANGYASELRGVEVELEGSRPVLVFQLSPPPARSPRSTGEVASRERSCDFANALVAEAERRPVAKTPDPTSGFGWALELDVASVQFQSVQRLTQDGSTIGFFEYWLGSRPDGMRVLASRSVLFMKRGPSWRASDTVHVEETDPWGWLKRGRYVRLGEGAGYRIELRRVGRGDGSFAYSGVVRGKPLEGTFQASGGLATGLLRIELFREGGAGPRSEPVNVQSYVPGDSPTRPVAAVHRRDPGREHGIVSQLGKREGAGVVAADGTLEWFEETGGSRLRFETIARSGAP
jgi:hypothetical protein